MVWWVFGVLACGGPKQEAQPEGPPEQPAHDLDEEGSLHALGLYTPFLCTSSDEAVSVPCPDERPPDAQLSCDASGCHGDFDFSPDTTPEQRHLLGSDGPSCFACHDQNWSDRTGEDDGGNELPEQPVHDLDEGGNLHALGLYSPFLCASPDGGARVACPDERPPDALLSCDASGCHGDFDFSPDADPEQRHLLGSDGPSCFACHEQSWSDRLDNEPSGGLPEVPAHDVREDGAAHASGLETPFLCLSANGRFLTGCPDTRPPDARLSCDASGCHGDFDFSPGTLPGQRHLLGAAGPSCFSCHGQIWSLQQTGFADPDDDSDSDDDSEDDDSEDEDDDEDR